VKRKSNHRAETLTTGNQPTGAKLTGSKLAAFPNRFQCKLFLSGSNHRRKAHRLKIGSVPELIPVQAVPIRKKPTEPQPETLTTGNQFTGSQLAAFPN